MSKQIGDSLLRDGFHLFRGLWSPTELRTATRLIRAALVCGLHASGVRVFHPSDLDPVLRSMLTSGTMANTVTAALGPCEFLSMKPVVKDDGLAFATPWHQDHLYWGGCTKWSLWMALEQVDPGNGCLRIIRGSHLRELPHQARTNSDLGFDNRLEVDEKQAEDVLLGPGDAILFHDLLLHASHPCAAGRSRIAIIPTYRSLGAIDASTIWTDPRPLETL